MHKLPVGAMIPTHCISGESEGHTFLGVGRWASIRACLLRMVDDSDPARRVRDSTILEKLFLSFLRVF
jgi:hypothetical protein